MPWHCGLCMSVWGGVVATAFLALLPWLNWPFALSLLYVTHGANRMTQKNDKADEQTIRVQAIITTLSQQRDAALNGLAEVNGELAILRHRITELTPSSNASTAVVTPIKKE